MDQITSYLTNLAVSLFVAVLVWRYYRVSFYPVSQKYLTFGPRFWTSSVDSCVLWPLAFGLNFLLTKELSPVAYAVVILVQNLTWLVYTVVMHAKYGQTCGKMVCKVKVVDNATEAAISWTQACLREGIPILIGFGSVAYEIYWILTEHLTPATYADGKHGDATVSWWLMVLPTVWFTVEALTMLTNEKRRSLHDFIAGTVVIRTNIRTNTGPE